MTDALAQDILAYVLECLIWDCEPMTKSEKKQMNVWLKTLDAIMHDAI